MTGDWHPMTAGFAVYQLAYGYGSKRSTPAASPARSSTAARRASATRARLWLGRIMNTYLPELGLGVGLAANSGLYLGVGVAGMNCSLSFDQLSLASQAAMLRCSTPSLRTRGSSTARPACPQIPTTRFPASYCVDAPSFGDVPGIGDDTTCAAFVKYMVPRTHLTTEGVCSRWLSMVTLSQLAGQVPGYKPPAGYDANTTTAVELCKATCMAVGSGPCWLDGPSTPWCAAAGPVAPQSRPRATRKAGAAASDARPCGADQMLRQSAALAAGLSLAN